MSHLITTFLYLSGTLLFPGNKKTEPHKTLSTSCVILLFFFPHRYNTRSACTCESFTIQALPIVVPVHTYKITHWGHTKAAPFDFPHSTPEHFILSSREIIFFVFFIPYFRKLSSGKKYCKPDS